MTTARIGIRELREDLSRAIRRVRRGQILEVTDHGHPVARIVPIVPVGGVLSQAIAEGRVRPARASGPLPEPLVVPTRMTGEDAMDVLRGE